MAPHLRLDNMLFAHGTPENPNLLLYPEDLPALLAGLPKASPGISADIITTPGMCPQEDGAG